MNKEELLLKYKEKKKDIEKKLEKFKNLPEKDYIHELIFCLLTPQSKAKKCWEAVVQLKETDNNLQTISSCLSTKTRFHNNKTKYVIEARKNWEEIEEKIRTLGTLELRNWLAENVLGLGMKEASHFLRNIGKSNNQIAILDRHILRNLKSLGVIKSTTSLSKKTYVKIEEKFLAFSKKIKIPIDELDLLFWSEEEGSIFK